MKEDKNTGFTPFETPKFSGYNFPAEWTLEQCLTFMDDLDDHQPEGNQR